MKNQHRPTPKADPSSGCALVRDDMTVVCVLTPKKNKSALRRFCDMTGAMVGFATLTTTLRNARVAYLAAITFTISRHLVE